MDETDFLLLCIDRCTSEEQDEVAKYLWDRFGGRARLSDINLMFLNTQRFK